MSVEDQWTGSFTKIYMLFPMTTKYGTIIQTILLKLEKQFQHISFPYYIVKKYFQTFLIRNNPLMKNLYEPTFYIFLN